MDPANSHTRHSTQVDSGNEKRTARIRSYVLVGLIVLQVASLAPYVPMFLELGRQGAISTGNLMLLALASGLLLLGAVRLLASSHAPRYTFAFSILFGLLAVRWLLAAPAIPPFVHAALIVLAGTVLAAAGLVISIWRSRKRIRDAYRSRISRHV